MNNRTYKLIIAFALILLLAFAVSCKPKEEKGEHACSCTLYIDCKTILSNREKLNPDKAELIPEDGVILDTVTVGFDEGESVYDVVLRELRKRNIHIESTFTPVYNSAYIEGINNIYEFDCGEMSGWEYCVNGVFPNYGCSQYVLSDGDEIKLLYTCELGADVENGSH